MSLTKLNILKGVPFFLLLLIWAESPAQTQLTVDLNNKGVPISPTHYGVFFEDINHAADGGLYAELIRNRSFEDGDNLEPWTLSNVSGAESTMSLETNDLLNQAQTKALKVKITAMPYDVSRPRIINRGFWGIDIKKGESYKVSFFAKCDSTFKGEVTVSLEDIFYKQYAKATITGIGQEWKKFTCTLKPNADYSNVLFMLTPTSTGTVWFDVVSMFPPTFKNRENGLRPDLTQKIADLHPKFLRFPGGCFVEGDWLANRFQWKKSIGPIEDRPGHYNLWGYRTTDGLGYYEYLQLCEDVGAEPLFVVNVGLAHNDYQPANDLSGYIQDALDAIEYANGDTTTTYGAMRAAAGHPQPFNLKYIEVGNENYYGNRYGDRYTQFYNAIKAKYPDIEFIGNVAAWGTDNPTWPFTTPTDFADEHYYRGPQWFIDNYKKYDTYDRNGPQIYVGEYAVTSECGLGNLAAAIGEAAYMCGMEKNSDIVPMNSYAPMFVNMNDRTWNPDMINFNAHGVYCTPSYYVQKMFANNIGTVNLQVADSMNTNISAIKGSIGLGTWATQADYDDIKVEKPDGTILINDSLNNDTAWAPYSGTWTIADGIYSQTSRTTDCRSITKSVSDSTYIYSLRARKTGGNEGFLIIFGYQDENNFYWWNLGGWGNTKHAVEHCVSGSKSVISEVPGSIQTDVWYDIKIKVTPSTVYCYLNDELVQSFDVPESKILYTAASLDESNGLIYLKVVNPSASDVETTLNFKGLNSNGVSGNVTVLTSGSTADENSMTNPENVYPAITSLGAHLPTFNYTIVANSVNIFKIQKSESTKVNEYHSNKFSVSPNPTTDHVMIHFKGQRTSEAQVYNLSGALVLSKQVEDGSRIDLSHLSPGIYVIHANGLGSKKIMKY